MLGVVDTEVLTDVVCVVLAVVVTSRHFVPSPLTSINSSGQVQAKVPGKFWRVVRGLVIQL